MGWQYRRTVRTFRDVRVDVTKNGVGLGIGGRGVRFSPRTTTPGALSPELPGAASYWAESVGDRGKPTLGEAATAGHVVRSLEDLVTLIHQVTPHVGLSEAVSQLASSLREIDDADVSAPNKSCAEAVRAALSEIASLDEPGNAETRLGLQPLPGLELLVPFDGLGILLLCACHLLAAGDIANAEVVLCDVPPCDESLLVAVASRMHASDPGGVLALGVPEVDSKPAWVAGLIRAQALFATHRRVEAYAVIEELELSSVDLALPKELQEVASVLRAEVLLADARLNEASRILVDVLGADPFDQHALAVLSRAHRLLYSRSASSSVETHNDGVESSTLQVVLASLERELGGAQQVLLAIIHELDRVASEDHRRLGGRRVGLAKIKARLAALVAQLSGSEQDEETAASCEDELRSQTELHDAQQDSELGAEELTAPDEAAPTPTAANERALRTLYLRLIKRWHPDLASSDDDRQRRTEMTARINTMYAKKDLAGLHKLWEHGTLPESETLGHTVAELMNLIERTRAELEETREEVASLLASPLERMRAQIAEAEHQGRDLFDEWAQRLDDEIRELEETLQSLEQQRATVAPTEPASNGAPR